MFCYRPESPRRGLAVLSERVVILLSEDWGNDAAVDAYRALDGGESLDAVLAALAADGRGRTVAAVEVLDARRRTVRAAVRGDAALEIDGGEVTDAGIADAGVTDAWIADAGVTDAVVADAGVAPAGTARSQATGIRGFRLELTAPGDRTAGDAAGRELPFRGGVVATGRIEFRARVRKGAADSRPPDDATRPVALVDRGADRDAYRDLGTAAGTEVLGGGTPRTPAVGVLPDRASAPASAWSFGLPDGSELDAALPTVIGRRPHERRRDPHSAVHVVVPSPRREISGEHLALGVDEHGPFARDLDSTNGTLLFSGDQPPLLLRDGAVARLAEGDILDLGEGCCVSVVARSAVRTAGVGSSVTNR